MDPCPCTSLAFDCTKNRNFMKIPQKEWKKGIFTFCCLISNILSYKRCIVVTKWALFLRSRLKISSFTWLAQKIIADCWLQDMFCNLGQTCTLRNKKEAMSNESEICIPKRSNVNRGCELPDQFLLHWTEFPVQKIISLGDIIRLFPSSWQSTSPWVLLRISSRLCLGHP